MRVCIILPVFQKQLSNCIREAVHVRSEGFKGLFFLPRDVGQGFKLLFFHSHETGHGFKELLFHPHVVGQGFKAFFFHAREVGQVFKAFFFATQVLGRLPNYFSPGNRKSGEPFKTLFLFTTDQPQPLKMMRKIADNLRQGFNNK